MFRNMALRQDQYSTTSHRIEPDFLPGWKGSSYAFWIRTCTKFHPPTEGRCCWTVRNMDIRAYQFSCQPFAGGSNVYFLFGAMVQPRIIISSHVVRRQTFGAYESQASARNTILLLTDIAPCMYSEHNSSVVCQTTRRESVFHHGRSLEVEDVQALIEILAFGHHDENYGKGQTQRSTSRCRRP